MGPMVLPKQLAMEDRRGPAPSARLPQGDKNPPAHNRVDKFARAFLCAMLLPLLAGPAFSQAPFSFDAAPGRLPKSVIPLDYDIALVPDIAGHTVDTWDASMGNIGTPFHGASLRRNTSSTLTGSLMVGTPDKQQKEIRP